ncbi:hypothetical protein DRQ15_07085 [candidate division KSB1 bacterium]|nr:MAG: hypothetical protein DRQ15_07085 [candidate division KSB1 bacterium]
MNSLPAVILCGVKEVSAFALTDALIKENVKIYAFDTDRKAAGLFHPGISDHLIVDKLGYEAVERLIEFGHSHGQPVLFPLDDEMAQFISDHREMLAEGCIVFMPLKNILNSTLDKFLTNKKLEELGFNVLPTIVCNSREDAEKFLFQYGYPAVIKKRFGSGGRQQTILHSESDVETKLRPETLGEDVILQSWVPGPLTNLVTVAGIREKNGRISHLFSARRLDVLQSKIYFQGVTTCVESTWNSELLEYAADMMEKLELEGVYELEFKQSEVDNLFYLLEINPRFWAWVRLPIFCGNDFAKGYLLAALGRNDGTDWHSRRYRLSVMYWRFILDVYSTLFQLKNGKIGLLNAMNKLSKRLIRSFANPRNSFVEERLWRKETWYWIRYYLGVG